jgi:hypothetical protein
MTDKFEDFDITISEETFHHIKIIMSHPDMDYLGVIEITDLSKCPGFQQKYGEKRKSVPIIHIHKGFLFHSRDIIFNSFNLDNEYSDVCIWLENYYGIKVNTEERTFTIMNTKDGSRKVIGY